jgi:hypothetical protein
MRKKQTNETATFSDKATPTTSMVACFLTRLLTKPQQQRWQGNHSLLQQQTHTTVLVSTYQEKRPRKQTGSIMATVAETERVRLSSNAVDGRDYFCPPQSRSVPGPGGTLGINRTSQNLHWPKFGFRTFCVPVRVQNSSHLRTLNVSHWYLTTERS